jgi:hypothetical protein
MQICAKKWPAPRELPTGQRVQCWAAEERNGMTRLSPQERAPLEREELSVADEA